MKSELSRHFQNELELVIFSILMLNCLDGILTIILVGTGKAVEANPLMAYLIGYHPLLFMLCKQLLVSLGAIILWRLRENFLAVVSMFAIFLVYYVNLLHQLRFFRIAFV